MECIKMGKVTATVVMNVEMTEEQMEKLFREVLKTKREKFLQSKLSLFGEDAKGTVNVDMVNRQFLFIDSEKFVPSLSKSVRYVVDENESNVSKSDMTFEDYYLLKAFDVLESL